MDVNINVKIEKLEIIAAAIDRLAAALTGTANPQQNLEVQQQPPMQPMPAPQQASMNPQSMVPTQVPMGQPMQAMPNVAPSTSQQYQPNYNQQSAPGVPVAHPGPAQGQPIQNAPVQGMIPTTHVTQPYTQEQLAVAMTTLVDAGKTAVIQAILQQFGVPALTEIPPERYPELATKLREAGAPV